MNDMGGAARELSVDCFAGGGGTSVGHEMALGYPPDIAINHDAVAIAMHKANHPTTRHLNSNIFKVIPSEALDGAVCGLLWLSPDCKHFSRAKGAKPVEKRIRGLAWVAMHWAKLPPWQRPRVIFLENVVEFETWGPLLADGRPDPERRGESFKRWVSELRRLGYKVDWRVMRCCDYSAPTIRQRLFLIARNDGEPIVWDEPTHGNPKLDAVKSGNLLPWRTAADDVIDWSRPCPSIFLSRKEVKRLWREHGIRVQRPLKPKTLARIYKGLVRFVLNNADPFIIPVTHAGDLRSHSVNEPVRTQTGAKRGEHALVTPTLEPVPTFEEWHADTKGLGGTREEYEGLYGSPGDGGEPVVVVPYLAGCGGRAGQSPPKGADEPLNTVTAKPDQVVLTPYLIPRYGERDGQEPRTQSVESPLSVVVPTGNGATLIAPHLSRQFGASVGSAADEPVGTVTAGGGGKTALVAAFLAQHNSERRGDGVKHGRDVKAPLGAITSIGNQQNVVAAFLAQHNYMEPGHDAREPLSTIVQKGCTQAVVSAGMVSLKGTERRGGSIEQPVPAITAQGGHLAEVRAFLMKYYSVGGQHQDPREPLHTDTAKARFGIVTVRGLPYQIVDIGMRMLTPRERFNAHAFPRDYKIDILVPRTIKGRAVLKPITLEEQGRMVGNSVPPVMAKVLISANYRPRLATERKPPRASEEFALQAAE